jgi:hypothetical protein
MRPDGGTDSAPIDRPILEHIRDRLAGTRQVRTAATTEDDRLELRVEFADSFHPDTVIAASLSIRWYTNDDFAIHYREAREPERWECQWDRHPSPHDTREHFHPPPDGSTPGRTPRTHPITVTSRATSCPRSSNGSRPCGTPDDVSRWSNPLVIPARVATVPREGR